MRDHFSVSNLNRNTVDQPFNLVQKRLPNIRYGFNTKVTNIIPVHHRKSTSANLGLYRKISSQRW